jgi:hypothetical protein
MPEGEKRKKGARGTKAGGLRIVGSNPRQSVHRVLELFLNSVVGDFPSVTF